MEASKSHPVNCLWRSQHSVRFRWMKLLSFTGAELCPSPPLTVTRPAHCSLSSHWTSKLSLPQLQSPPCFLSLEVSNEIWAQLRPGGWRGNSLMSWGEGRTGEGRSGEMTSTPGTGRWAGRCCCIQGLDAQSPGCTALWSWLLASRWRWCEFFTTLCLKIYTSGPHIYNFILPQNKETINQWPGSKSHEPPGGIWNLTGLWAALSSLQGKAFFRFLGERGSWILAEKGKKAWNLLSLPGLVIFLLEVYSTLISPSCLRWSWVSRLWTWENLCSLKRREQSLCRGPLRRLPLCSRALHVCSGAPVLN